MLLAQSGAAEEMAKAARIREQAQALKDELPWAIVTPEDIRAYAVWWQTEERHWAAYGRAMSLIFDTEVVGIDDQEALDAIRRRDLDPLGERVKLFADFCAQELIPLVERLEKGLGLLQALDPGDPKREQYLALFERIRQEVRRALPEAWRLIGAAAHMYRRLPEDLREEAERRWGPLAGTDPGDFSPPWHRHGPGRRLEAIDRDYRKLSTREGP